MLKLRWPKHCWLRFTTHDWVWIGAEDVRMEKCRKCGTTW